jgi:hypothetical protein
MPLQNRFQGAHTVFSYSMGALASATGRSSAGAAAPGRRT